jgi:hypothetical protein
MIGSDGAFGASQAFDGTLPLNHVVMQVPWRCLSYQIGPLMRIGPANDAPAKASLE